MPAETYRMNLKGGIIIIGSLLWDNSKKREAWRNSYLDVENKIAIKLPIRYGRISSSRMNTYTMIYSAKLEKGEYGEGIILKFKKTIEDFEYLIDILENTIRVERDKTKDEWKYIKKGEVFTLNWDWGVLGLCINPKHKNDNNYSQDISLIAKYWKSNLSDFNPRKFANLGEDLFINNSGIFEIDWIEEIGDLDFIISAIIEPKPETQNSDYPDSEMITKRMYEGNYYSYFVKNIENGISTKDDIGIIELIKANYDVSHFLEHLGKGKPAPNKR